MGAALGAVGGSLIGGLAGVAVEHVATDTKAYEYIVRKTNGDMLSVTQKDAKPLAVGQRVLVIGGNQARIVADYTVPAEPATKEKAAETAKDGRPAATEPGAVAATSLAPPAVIYPDPSKVGSSPGSSSAAPFEAAPAAPSTPAASPSAAATPAAARAQATSPPTAGGPTVMRNDVTPP